MNITVDLWKTIIFLKIKFIPTKTNLIGIVLGMRILSSLSQAETLEPSLQILSAVAVVVVEGVLFVMAVCKNSRLYYAAVRRK